MGTQRTGIETRTPVPFEPGLWAWGAAEPTRTTYLGRECILLESSTATATGVELTDGTVEVDLAVGAERGFHGVFWRGRDDENVESFFVRPHQVGNPDAVQYTPVFKGISSWQLYHRPGYWAPVAFPLGEWFRIRVVFSGTRAEVYVGDLDVAALSIGELKGPVAPGGIGGAVVYLNGQARYRGDDTYRSRDYRFLGSIGYYDALYLPLEQGDNELVVAVSETFGGWGVQARFVDLRDLALET